LYIYWFQKRKPNSILYCWFSNQKLRSYAGDQLQTERGKLSYINHNLRTLLNYRYYDKKKSTESKYRYIDHSCAQQIESYQHKAK